MASPYWSSCILFGSYDAVLVNSILPNPSLPGRGQLLGVRCCLYRITHLDNIMVQKKAGNCLWYRQLRIINWRNRLADHVVSPIQAYRLWVDYASSRLPIPGSHDDLMSSDQGEWYPEAPLLQNLRLPALL